MKSATQIQAIQLKSGKWVCRRKIVGQTYCDYLRRNYWTIGSQASRFKTEAAALKAGKNVDAFYYGY